MSTLQKAIHSLGGIFLLALIFCTLSTKTATGKETWSQARETSFSQRQTGAVRSGNIRWLPPVQADRDHSCREKDNSTPPSFGRLPLPYDRYLPVTVAEDNHWNGSVNRQSCPALCRRFIFPKHWFW